MTNPPKPVAEFASGARLGGILPFVPGKRGYRLSEIDLILNGLTQQHFPETIDLSGCTQSKPGQGSVPSIQHL
jgi:hypothetical protein